MSKQLIDEFATATICNIIEAVRGAQDRDIDSIAAECNEAYAVMDRIDRATTSETELPKLTAIQTTKLIIEDMMHELIGEIKDEIKLEILTQVQLDLDDIRAQQATAQQAQLAPKRSMLDVINDFALVGPIKK